MRAWKSRFRWRWRGVVRAGIWGRGILVGVSCHRDPAWEIAIRSQSACLLCFGLLQLCVHADTVLPLTDAAADRAELPGLLRNITEPLRRSSACGPQWFLREVMEYRFHLSRPNGCNDATAAGDMPHPLASEKLVRLGPGHARDFRRSSVGRQFASSVRIMRVGSVQ